MIERDSGKMLFVCDECNEAFESEDGETFQDTWAAAKDDGWRARKLGNDWVHACPDCAKTIRI
jgi:Fe2+ or Zn2+ uptake regulation protein